MNRKVQGMKISDLSENSGLPISTLKFYIREGLLPRPMKTGKTKGFYHPNCRKRIALIKKLRQEEKMPIKKIKEIIDVIDDGIEDGNDAGYGAWLDKSLIIKKAIKLFREKGYEKTTIADIVEMAQIGRGTFYKYFQNKKGLFLACIQEIIRDESEMFKQVDFSSKRKMYDSTLKTGQAYSRQYPVLRDMINILRAAAINDPDEFAEIYEKAIHMKVEFFKNHLVETYKAGLFRKIDFEVGGAMLVGIIDFCAEYFAKNSPEKFDRELIEEIINIFQNGVLKNNSVLS